uniref:Uncharacterized protein n=1 Tax=Rhizophora mucronata TaxID=61149 RepID=A0A2P2PGA8_RHIMU
MCMNIRNTCNNKVNDTKDSNVPR